MINEWYEVSRESLGKKNNNIHFINKQLKLKLIQSSKNQWYEKADQTKEKSYRLYSKSQGNNQIKYLSSIDNKFIALK
jgi:hypothetical protein